MSIDYKTHMSHCNMGDYEGSCKYGEDFCPAMFGIDIENVTSGIALITDYVEFASTKEHANFVNSMVTELIMVIINQYEQKIANTKTSTIDNLIEELRYRSETDMFAPTITKTQLNVATEELSEFRKKQVEKYHPLPPNLTDKEFFERCFEKCGCYGRFKTCDCVSVFNKVSMNAWYDYNTGG